MSRATSRTDRRGRGLGSAREGCRGRRGSGLAAFVVFAFWALAAAVPAPAQLDPIAASVNGTVITERDLDFYAVELQLESPDLFRAPRPVLYRRMLPQVIEERLLYESLWRAGFEDFAEEDAREAAAEAWRELEDLAGGEWRLRALLEEVEIRPSHFRAWLVDRGRREWLIQQGLRAEVDPALFNRRDDSPANAVRIRISMIEFSKGPDRASASGRAEAIERAARIRLEILEGLPFERAAAIYSENRETGTAGGSLGWIEVDALARPVRETVLALPVRGMTPPIDLGDRVALVRLEDFETPSRRALLEALSQARQRLLAAALDGAEIVLSPGFEEAGPRPRPYEPPSVWERILDTRTDP